MRRNTVKIGDDRFTLAQGHDIDEVKAATVSAIRSGGDLVNLVVYGNREVSVLVSPGVAVVFTSEPVPPEDQDDRDTGDVEAPFSALTDYEYL